MVWNKSTKVVVGATVSALVIAGAVIFFLHWHDPKRRAIAKAETAIEKQYVEPVAMTNYVTTPASYFAQIKQFPAWGTVPIGFQVFDGVPLQIDGMICLYGEGNHKMGIDFPESYTGIMMNKRFETLYIYHGCFFESPKGTPVYEVVFNYADNTSETNQVLYGDDLVDWMVRVRGSPPSGTRSKLAWQAKPPLPPKTPAVRFCLTAIDNPYPSFEVVSIDLHSLKSRTAPCILAVTTGNKGQMK